MCTVLTVIEAQSCSTESEGKTMSYVQWKSSKYHALTRISPRGLKIEDGRASASRQDGSGLALTDCGSEIPVDNEVFDRLPDGTNRDNEVCHRCSDGVGVPKVDRDAEEARQKAAREDARKRIYERNLKLAKDLFD
jgi:hypothetical protein